MDSPDEPRSSPPSTSAVDLDELARRDEEQYVHEVYETIASHFSSTRYKVSLAIGFNQTLHGKAD